MTLALFDFDGTMTTQDSLTLFMQRSGGKVRFLWLQYGCTLPHYVAYRAGWLSLETLKAKRFKRFLGNMSWPAFDEYATWFNQDVIPRIMRPKALEKLHWHLAQGHHVWVVSASVDCCIGAWVQAQGAGLLTNTLDRKAARPRLTFPRPDCNGEEKVRRIQDALTLSDYDTIYAYGDTEGDQPMLAIAHHPHFRVFE